MLYEVITEQAAQAKATEDRVHLTLHLAHFSQQIPVPHGCSPPRCCPGDFRITSYNVCYTKLLRAREKLRLAIDYYRTRNPEVDIVLIEPGSDDRITSYNVCYTKLLRFDSLLRLKGQQLLVELDNWLSSQESENVSKDPDRRILKTGVGIYHYIEED